MGNPTSKPDLNHDPDQCPGTVRLVQQQWTNNYGGQTRGGTIILMPQPAKTLNDPLNWPRWQKAWHYAIHLVWIFFANASIAWTSPAWTVWTSDLNTSYTFLTYGQAALVVMCGFGVLFFQPWATKFGRRLPYIFGSALIICGLLCGRFMTDSRLYLAYQIIAGFGSAPAYSTIIMSLLDVSFLHQRGRILALFGLVLIAGNFLPPIAAGYIVDRQGWEWCFNYLLILFGITSIALAFTGEESLFSREIFEVRSDRGGDVIPVHETSGQLPVGAKCDEKQGTSLAVSVSLERTCGHVETFDTNRLPYGQRMTLYRKNKSTKAGYWLLTFSIFRVVLLPAAIWMSIMLSLGSFVVGVILTTLASFFSPPPYNFSAATMGLMYFPLVIGAVLGSVWGGPCTDWLLLRLARRNEGIYEPEHRLWIYLPIPVIGAAGILLYGVGAAQGIHWAVPCLGLVFVGFYLDASTPIAMGFALDCYPDLEAQVVQLSNFLRNVLGGAFTFGLQPWINYSGVRTTVIVIAAVVFALNAMCVCFLLGGRRVRFWSAKRYLTVRDQALFYG